MYKPEYKTDCARWHALGLSVILNCCVDAVTVSILYKWWCLVGRFLLLLCDKESNERNWKLIISHFVLLACFVLFYLVLCKPASLHPNLQCLSLPPPPPPPPHPDLLQTKRITIAWKEKRNKNKTSKQTARKAERVCILSSSLVNVLYHAFFFRSVCLSMWGFDSLSLSLSLPPPLPPTHPAFLPPSRHRPLIFRPRPHRLYLFFFFFFSYANLPGWIGKNLRHEMNTKINVLSNSKH